MTSVATPGLDNAPTTHGRLRAWVQEMAERTTPFQLVCVDGSDEEWDFVAGRGGDKRQCAKECNDGA